MNHRLLGCTDLNVSPLCYGTVAFGTTAKGDALLALYDQFRAAGGNFFDTAHCYCFWIDGAHGASERALGACIRQRGDRDRVVIATKGGHPDAGPQYRRPADYLAAPVIAQDITESLERLGTDRIDLYWLHRDAPRVPVSDIIETLNAEIARGRIRYLGASNWTTDRIAAANQHAQQRGLHGFVASQPRWSLAQPNPVKDSTNLALREADRLWHIQSQIAVIPYSPTACGYFASDGARARDQYENPRNRERLQRAKTLAASLGATPNQIALAYLLNQPFPVIPILGTANPAHLQDALAATTIPLTPAHLTWLRDGGDPPNI